MTRPTPRFLLALLLVAPACARVPDSLGEADAGSAQEAAARARAEALLARSTAPEAPPLAPVSPEVVSHGPRNLKQVALTFDACSTRDVNRYDVRVTNELIAAHAPATLFVGGSWAVEEADQVRQLAANPLFELGNHTFTHPHMPKLSEPRMLRELARTQAELLALTGVQPRLFRPPYGEYDQRVVHVAAALGLTTVEYDLPSGDPDQHATKERLIKWVLEKAQPGSIVVMHINHTRFHTAEALPAIIEGLRARGFELVTVSTLLRETHGEPLAGTAGP